MLAVLLYFVVAIGVCLLLWAVFVLFTRFGLDETMFFTDKSTLAKGFFDSCHQMLYEVLKSIEQMLSKFIKK